MRAAVLPTRAMALGPYPERSNDGEHGAPSYSGRQLPAALGERRQQRFLDAVDAHSSAVRALSASAFSARVREVRASLGAEGFTDQAMSVAFALVREAT